MSGMPSNSGAQAGSGAVGKRPNRVEFAASSQAQERGPVRVALVDDEAEVHEFLRSAFKILADTWTLDSYLDARDALKQIPQAPPQVVLVDYEMPVMTGLACAENLKACVPDLRIIMFSAHMSPEILLSCFSAGACGCLCKPADLSVIMAAIPQSMSGWRVLCPRAESMLMQCFHILGGTSDGPQFTRRQRDIINCLYQEKSDKEIAETLKVDPGTVHWHMAGIFKKLNVHSRAEVVSKIVNGNQPGVR